MIFSDEHEGPPLDVRFDVAVVAVGYERRCRWIFENVWCFGPEDCCFGIWISSGWIV